MSLLSATGTGIEVPDGGEVYIEFGDSFENLWSSVNGVTIDDASAANIVSDPQNQKGNVHFFDKPSNAFRMSDFGNVFSADGSSISVYFEVMMPVKNHYTSFFTGYSNDGTFFDNNHSFQNRLKNGTEIDFRPSDESANRNGQTSFSTNQWYSYFSRFDGSNNTAQAFVDNSRFHAATVPSDSEYNGFDRCTIGGYDTNSGANHPEYTQDVYMNKIKVFSRYLSDSEKDKLHNDGSL